MESLKKLPRSDIDSIRKGINALLASDALEPDSRPSPAARRIFDLAMTELQAAGLMAGDGYSFFRLPNKQSFADKSERLLAFAARQHRDRRVQEGILRKGIELLIKQLRKQAFDAGDFTVS